MKLVQPSYDAKSFTCPYCNTLAQQYWSYGYIYRDQENNSNITNNAHLGANYDKTIAISTCGCCKKYHLWYDNTMIIPDTTVVPYPVNDMPVDVKEIYMEAREVFGKSAKAAAALLRLALQYLCKHLGEKGKNINADIKELVQKGLDVRIQKSLDILRITGNNAVHPGELDLDDNKDIAFNLFKLMNFIVTKMITEPKEIDDFFDSMPANSKAGIIKRDKLK